MVHMLNVTITEPLQSNQDDKRRFELDADTLVMVRGAVTTKDSYLDLISQIERYGFCSKFKGVYRSLCR